MLITTLPDFGQNVNGNLTVNLGPYARRFYILKGFGN